MPLTGWEIEHLLALKVLSNGSMYVLPKRRKKKGEVASSAQLISRSVRRLRERFEAIGILAFTPHDIRRTGRTTMAMLDVDPKIAERVLNHSEGEIVKTYDLWEYVPQKRLALEKLDAYYKSLRLRDAPTPTAAEIIRQWDISKRKKARLGRLSQIHSKVA